MSGRLPIFINPVMYARRGLQIKGSLRLADMERLAERILDPKEDVEVQAEFGILDGRGYMKGRVTGTLYVECQRCLQPLRMDIAHEFKLGMIESEAEIPLLREDEEPLITSGDEMALADIIEDELLLLLPMVPAHPAGECVADAGRQTEQEDTGERENPFARLADLKKELI